MYGFGFTLGPVGAFAIERRLKKWTVSKRMPNGLRLEPLAATSINVPAKVEDNEPAKTVELRFSPDDLEFKVIGNDPPDLKDDAAGAAQVAAALSTLRSAANEALTAPQLAHERAGEVYVPYPDPRHAQSPRPGEVSGGRRAWRRAHSEWLRQQAGDAEPAPMSGEVWGPDLPNDPEAARLRLRADALAYMLGQIPMPVSLTWAFSTTALDAPLSGTLHVPDSLNCRELELVARGPLGLRFETRRDVAEHRLTVCASTLLATAVFVQRLWPCDEVTLQMRAIMEPKDTSGGGQSIREAGQTICTMIIDLHGWGQSLRDAVSMPIELPLDLKGVCLDAG